MINGEPEDELRRLVIAFYPADGEMAVFEVPVMGAAGFLGVPKCTDTRPPNIRIPCIYVYIKLHIHLHHKIWSYQDEL